MQHTTPLVSHFAYHQVRRLHSKYTHFYSKKNMGSQTPWLKGKFKDGVAAAEGQQAEQNVPALDKSSIS